MWRRLTAGQSKLLERIFLAVLGLVLFLRFPGKFILSEPYVMTFEVYRAVAVRLLHGGAAHLYDSTTSATALFKYSPLWALLWTPLGWLPAHLGVVLWTMGNLLILFAALVMCARLCRRASIRYHPLTAVLTILILVRPLTSEFLNGNVNILWGCLVVGFVYATVLERRWLAAGCLAMAILLKLPAVVFLPYLLIRRQWAVTRRVVAIACIATILTSSLLVLGNPLPLIAQWFRVLATSGPDRAFEIGNQSAFALLARFLTQDGYGLNLLRLSSATIMALGTGLLILAVSVLGLQRPKGFQPSNRFLFDSAILMMLMVLFSPTCWIATYSALVFPVFLMVGFLTHQFAQRQFSFRSLILLGVTIGVNLLTHRKFWRPFGITHWHGETYLFLVFMVLPWFGVALTALLWHQRSLAIDAEARPHQTPQ